MMQNWPVTVPAAWLGLSRGQHGKIQPFGKVYSWSEKIEEHNRMMIYKKITFYIFKIQNCEIMLKQKLLNII